MLLAARMVMPVPASIEDRPGVMPVDAHFQILAVRNPGTPGIEPRLAIPMSDPVSQRTVSLVWRRTMTERPALAAAVDALAGEAALDLV